MIISFELSASIASFDTLSTRRVWKRNIFLVYMCLYKLIHKGLPDPGLFIRKALDPAE